MDYRLEDYRRHNGRTFLTPDGHKYYKSKVRDNNVYLRCVLFRNGCKATAKLNLVSNLITPGMNHNYSILEYQSDLFELMSKCKNRARNSQDNLRKVHSWRCRSFSCVVYLMRTFNVPFEEGIATKDSNICRTFWYVAKYRFGAFYTGCTVSVIVHMAIILFSDKIWAFFSQITNIKFDRTFCTVPVFLPALDYISDCWSTYLTRNTLSND